MREEKMSEYQSWASKFGGYAKDMTLRDYFAAKVLPTLITNDGTDLDEDVRDAYMIADKMLKARAK